MTSSVHSAVYCSVRCAKVVSYTVHSATAICYTVDRAKFVSYTVFTVLCTVHSAKVVCKKFGLVLSVR